ncbi:MAG TPA: PqiC family protein [Steroidobacteraceae bacterium]
MRFWGAVAVVLLMLGGCVTHHPDHYYVIDSQPSTARETNTPFARQVTLRVSVPSLVDRAEIVVSTADGVTVAEHERWAAPLPDLITATLARDIERRRDDVVVLPHRLDEPGVPLTEIAIEVNEVRSLLGHQVSVAAHWRVTDAGSGKVTLGRDAFISNLHSDSYAALAEGLSASLALLADRLVQEIPAQ